MPLKDRVLGLLTNYMSQPVREPDATLSDFGEVQKYLRPGDIVMISGRTRTSGVIQTVTVSTWTHAVLYVGRLGELRDRDLAARLRERGYAEDEQIAVESELGQGVVANPIARYAPEHVRLCRPWRLDEAQTRQVIDYATSRLDRDFDTRQILDMLRFFFPYPVVPRRWRSKLFEAGHGDATEEVCSTMIAEAFEAADYAVLPRTLSHDGEGRPVRRRRNMRLMAPRDFDYSPYFDIIKYPLPGEPPR